AHTPTAAYSEPAAAGESTRRAGGKSAPFPPLPPLRGDAHPQRVQADESGGVGLVVGAAVVLEGRDPRIEERVRLRVAADDGDVALVELEPHAAVHAELRGVDQGLKELPLRAPPVAVVDERGVARHQFVLE